MEKHETQAETPNELSLLAMVKILKAQRNTALDLAASHEATAKIRGDAIAELMDLIAKQKARIAELENPDREFRVKFKGGDGGSGGDEAPGITHQTPAISNQE